MSLVKTKYSVTETFVPISKIIPDRYASAFAFSFVVGDQLGVVWGMCYLRQEHALSKNDHYHKVLKTTWYLL